MVLLVAKVVTAVIAIGGFAGVAADMAFGDASAAALIAASGSIIVTVLTLRNNRQIKLGNAKLDHVQKVLTSPRRLIYNEEGRPIGTVLDLRDDFDLNTIVESGRRHSDPE